MPSTNVDWIAVCDILEESSAAQERRTGESSLAKLHAYKAVAEFATLTFLEPYIHLH
jgi:hypothetical protein